MHTKKGHNTAFNILKCRVKPVNKYGKEELKKHRLISLSKMRSDNLFKYPEDILIKRKLRNYNLKLKGYTTINNRDTYIIAYQNKEYSSDKGTLYIDKETFALASARFYDKKINFYCYNNKWYVRDVVTEFTSISNKHEERISIYELQKSSVKLEGKRPIMVEKVKPFIGDFNDDFWKNFTHIPLEEKYRQQVESAD